MRYQLRLAAGAAVLWGCVLAAQTQDTTGKPDTQPTTSEASWTEPVDGLSCRLIVAKDALLNEPLWLVFEIKNVSDRKRFVVAPAKAMPADRFFNNDFAKLSATDAKGAAIGPGQWGSFSLAMSDFKPIAPGEVLRARFNLLTANSYRSVPTTAGEYHLKLTYTSPKPARRKSRAVASAGGSTGSRSSITSTPTRPRSKSTTPGPRPSRPRRQSPSATCRPS